MPRIRNLLVIGPYNKYDFFFYRGQESDADGQKTGTRRNRPGTDFHALLAAAYYT